jgi:hypothetical protein
VAAVGLVLLMGLLLWFALSLLHKYRASVVAQRGTSTTADIGAMNSYPRVRVRSVVTTGHDVVHLVLTPDAPEHDGGTAADDVDVFVYLNEAEFGFELLDDWKRAKSPLAFVRPPDSRIVRLRAIDDLQPLTLRVVDD